MGKIVVADESDVRKVVKDELKNFSQSLRSDFFEFRSKLQEISNKLSMLEKFTK